MISGVRPHQSGYTIIELILVLAVSIALLASALIVFRGRVPRTQFTTSVEQFATELRGIVNQVSTGSYPTSGGFHCTGGNLVAASPEEQGENENCVYNGQVILFGVQEGANGTCSGTGDVDCDTIKVYTAFGQLGTVNDISKSISESAPHISNDFANRKYAIGYGTHIITAKAWYTSAAATPIDSMAYFQSFGSRINANQQAAGAPQVQINPIATFGAVGVKQNDFLTSFRGISDGIAAGINPLVPASKIWDVQGSSLPRPNPAGGISICLKSAGTKQYAILWLAKSGAVDSVAYDILERAPTSGVNREACRT